MKIDKQYEAFYNSTDATALYDIFSISDTYAIHKHPLKTKYQNVLSKMEDEIEKAFYEYRMKYNHVCASAYDMNCWLSNHRKVEEKFKRESILWSKKYIEVLLDHFKYIKDIVAYAKQKLSEINIESIIRNKYYMFSWKGDSLLGTCLLFLKTYYGEEVERKLLLSA